MDELIKSMKVSASGMKAQGTRLRVISENLANADSLPERPGETPYRRKVILFENMLDRELKASIVKVDKTTVDRSDFPRRYEPSHPAADAEGYVLTPNVNSLIEVMDMREAERSYEANLNAIKTSKEMITRAIGLLR
ncbi:MAG: flagellar basal body rod protein FlgC [Magnetospiraceae bacterium]